MLVPAGLLGTAHVTHTATGARTGASYSWLQACKIHCRLISYVAWTSFVGGNDGSPTYERMDADGSRATPPKQDQTVLS